MKTTESKMAPQNIKHDNFDIDRSGNVSQEEIDHVRHMVEVEILSQRAKTQKWMGWIAMLSMVAFNLFLFSSWVSDQRVETLADLLGLFYITQASIVGAYMGITAWISMARTR